MTTPPFRLSPAASQVKVSEKGVRKIAVATQKSRWCFEKRESKIGGGKKKGCHCSFCLRGRDTKVGKEEEEEEERVGMVSSIFSPVLLLLPLKIHEKRGRRERKDV